jgi:hypothetical protein
MAERRYALIAAIAEARGWIDDRQLTKSVAIPPDHPQNLRFTSL